MGKEYFFDGDDDDQIEEDFEDIEADLEAAEGSDKTISFQTTLKEIHEDSDQIEAELKEVARTQHFSAKMGLLFELQPSRIPYASNKYQCEKCVNILIELRRSVRNL